MGGDVSPDLAGVLLVLCDAQSGCQLGSLSMEPPGFQQLALCATCVRLYLNVERVKADTS